jgi:cell division protease FtsH
VELLKSNRGIIWFYLIVIVAIIFIASLLASGNTEKAVKYSDVVKNFKEENVTAFVIDQNNVITMQLKSGKVVEYQLRYFEIFYDDLHEIISDQQDRGVLQDYDYEPATSLPWWVRFLPYLIVIGVFIFLWWKFISRAAGKSGSSSGTGGGLGGRMNSFTKARTKLGSDEKHKVLFSDVAGADEEKEELKEIVEFLKNPSKFNSLGAKIPRGVLLVGAPGTGKTLLAKAVAGEANVPFLSISGSDFVEMFVGVGASRVRDLFATAKRLAPSLVFIDEIDAVGRQRGAGLGGGHDEKEQTLNQLLVEMDGFDGNQGVIVIAATNRPDVLDPALLRPGRFDRQIPVDYPDVKGRAAILRLYAETKPMADDVDLEKIAKLTPGMTGADLENILNEAAILATRRKLKAIDTDLISEAMKRVTWGPEKKSRVVTPESKFSTATHEVGHAIVMKMLPNCDPIDELSVIQRGRALGYTSYIPSDDRTSLTKGKMLDEIAGLMGGRMAEAVRLSDISTGAQNDLKRATELAKRMVTEFGMSDALGPVFLAGSEEVFIGREWGHQPNYSEAMAADIDAEVRRILEEAADRARRIIEENADAMTRVIDALVEHEHITGSEFDRLLKGVDDWQDKPAAVPAEASFEAIEKAMTELPADADHAEAPEEDGEDAGLSGPEEEKGSDV